MKEQEQNEEEEGKNVGEVLSPTRRRISDGIISIMARLNLSRAGADGQGALGIGTTGKNECHLSPLQLNVHCNNNCETVLHSAVRGKHADVAGILLQCGADPNVSCRQPESVSELQCSSLSLHVVLFLVMQVDNTACCGDRQAC
jgi:hypothetical protein